MQQSLPPALPSLVSKGGRYTASSRSLSAMQSVRRSSVSRVGVGVHVGAVPVVAGRDDPARDAGVVVHADESAAARVVVRGRRVGRAGAAAAQRRPLGLLLRRQRGAVDVGEGPQEELVRGQQRLRAVAAHVAVVGVALPLLPAPAVPVLPLAQPAAPARLADRADLPPPGQPAPADAVDAAPLLVRLAQPRRPQGLRGRHGRLARGAPPRLDPRGQGQGRRRRKGQAAMDGAGRGERSG